MTEATREANRLATVFGGSGFLGRYIVRALVHEGWRVRVAVRRPDLAAFLQPIGGVGQIQPVQANLRFPDSIAAALEGASAAVNATGVTAESGAQTFKAVHVEGAPALARAAVAARVSSYVHISGIGADPNSASPYIASKGLGEKATRETFPDAVVLRPSVVFGPEDGFFNRFGALACYFPALPLLGGGESRLQPVYVGDVARAVAAALSGLAKPGTTYELGGPRTMTLREAAELTLSAIDRRRLLIGLPLAPSRWIASSHTVRVESDIRAFSQIVDDDPRSSRFACVRQRRIRGGGSRGTRAERPRRPAAGRRGDHPVLSGAVSPDRPI